MISNSNKILLQHRLQRSGQMSQLDWLLPQLEVQKPSDSKCSPTMFRKLIWFCPEVKG